MIYYCLFEVIGRLSGLHMYAWKSLWFCKDSDEWPIFLSILLHVMKQDHLSNLRFLHWKTKFLNCLLLIMYSNFITKHSFLTLIHLCKDFTHIWRITVFKLFSMTCSAIYGQNVQTTIGQKLSAPFNYFTRTYFQFLCCTGT